MIFLLSWHDLGLIISCQLIPIFNRMVSVFSTFTWILNNRYNHYGIVCYSCYSGGMSTVHVHVGQCGNQIGREFWLKACSAAKTDENIKRAFLTPSGPGPDEHGHIRAVFVDSERKVVQKILNDGKLKKNGCRRLKLGAGNVLSCAKGCGSNWSMGHNYLAKESVLAEWKVNPYSYSSEFDYGNENSILKTTMEVIRRDVEACDCFSGFVLWHSLAGGTGSGFGSKLSAELRERYPVAYQMNVVVSPLMTGESPMQPYNELLCLASLQQDSDAIVMFKNDDVMDSLATKTKSSDQVSFDQMNLYVADCMFSLLSPVSSLTPPKGLTIGIEPWELVRSVSPMHNLKFLDCRLVSEKRSARPTSARPETWDSLSNNLCQQIRTKYLGTKSAAQYDDSSLATVCVCRNPSRSIAGSVDVAKLASKLKSTYNCVKWNPFPVDVWIDEGKSIKPSQKNSVKSITTCSNLTSFGTVHCTNLLKAARIKFDARAYLHWYERYGTYDTDFKESFEIIETVVDDYRNASAC